MVKGLCVRKYIGDFRLDVRKNVHTENPMNMIISTRDDVGYAHLWDCSSSRHGL